ncbi:hypothetical protein [Leucobacter luti]|uniref:hypothetical protein n=1 Tax=Leucobacter luti TaxID=340320 RepID=UPI00105C8869|nr:hypothetical protein [Leucobacter luti]
MCKARQLLAGHASYTASYASYPRAREVRAGYASYTASYASYPRATPAQCETVEADPETNVTSQDRPQLIE